MKQNYVIGIDVSKLTLDIAITQDGQQWIKEARVSNDQGRSRP